MRRSPPPALEPLRLAGLLLLASLAAAAPARAGVTLEQRLDDRIERVTLFSDQALVRRSAEARLGAGTRRVSFSEMPAAYDENSVRVLVDGGRLLGFEVVRGYGLEELPPELEAKRDRIEAIDRAIAVIDGQRATLHAEVSFLTNVPPGGAQRDQDGDPPPIDPAAYKRFLDWSTARLDAVGKELIRLDLARVELVEEREVLSSELLGTSGAGAALSRPRVVATVDVEAPATASLTLVYRTYDARWVPAYDIRLATGSEQMELGVNALVWQQTREDWERVELELSTAVPGRSAALPELMAWFIEETPPPPPPPSVTTSEDRARRSSRAERKSKVAQSPAPSAEEALAYDYEADYDYAPGYYDYGAGYAAPMDQPAPAPPPASASAGLLGAMGAGRGGGGVGSLDGVVAGDVAGGYGYGASTGSIADVLASELQNRSYLQDTSATLLGTQNRHGAITGGGVAFDPIRGRDQVAAPAVTAAYDSSIQTWPSYMPSSHAMGFDFSFHAEGEVTVPSDGQVHKLPLKVQQLPARIEHVVVPVVEQAAFVQAVVDNGSPYPMLAGMGNVYLDGEYLGQVPTQTVAPGQPLELALGIDRSVKVERKQQQLSDKGGIFGTQKVRAYEVAVKFENYRGETVHVKLLDRVPYTYDEQIKIVDVEHSAPPSEDHGNGMLEWTLDLKPGAKQDVTFTYTLKHSKNYKVWHPED